MSLANQAQKNFISNLLKKGGFDFRKFEKVLERNENIRLIS
jgi:hypothetical protein